MFCAWGVLILSLPIPIDDPFGLLVIGAAMSGLMMWPYIVVVQLINAVRLPEHTMPGWGRIAAMWFAAAFFGYFSVLLVGTGLSTQGGLSVFAVQAGILGSALGGYALWAGYGAVQVYVLYRVGREKLATAGTVEDAGLARGWFP